eukprot:gene33522-37886_t
MAPGTYYYVVTAQTPSGTSAASNEAKVSTAATLHTWLPFDETSGTAASDASGNGRHAALLNGPLWSSGKRAGALALDGVDDYVALPAGLVAGLSDFTVAVWVYWNGGRSWERIFDFGSGTSHYMFLTPQASGSGVRFAIATNGGVGEQRLGSSSPLPANQWVHVAVTLAGATG